MRGILNISMPVSMIREMKAEAKEGGFATASEFIRHIYRMWNTEKLANDLKKADRDWKKKKNWVKLNSMKDLM